MFDEKGELLDNFDKERGTSLQSFITCGTLGVGNRGQNDKNQFN